MAIQKRDRRGRPSALRRSSVLHDRGRLLTALVEIAFIDRVRSRCRGGVASVKCAHGCAPERVEQHTTPDLPAGNARLVRVRTCHSHNLLYAADDPTGFVATQTSRPPIRFGGVYGGYGSNIVLTSQEDLIYFDQISDSLKQGIPRLPSTSAGMPSELEWIALDIGQLYLAEFQPIISTIDNPSLAGVFLVVTLDDIRDVVRDVQSDQWGFREIQEDDLREHAPTLYYKGLKVVQSFNSILEEGVVEYIFVFDWDQYGKGYRF
ncbi:hypothetical protein F5Y08DRAFT_343770 [Xylaria arbuscula]|nr:hypothetical protein F5Y08DRAFT_343770 [Xylaria arbuscula]